MSRLPGLIDILRADSLGPGELEQVRRARLAALLDAGLDTPFQAERLAACGVRRHDPAWQHDPFSVLTAITPIGKSALRAAGAAAVRGGRIDRRWHSSLSSGSTGEPFRMYFGRADWITLKYLVKARTRFARGVRLTDRIAVLDVLPAEHADRGWLARAGRVRRFSILRPPELIALELADFRPTAICGLPSALLDLADVLRLQRRSLGRLQVFTGGEVLTRAARHALRTAFGGAVVDIYGTSETKEIAWECPAGRLHVNADVVHVEVLDRSGTPLPAGAEGDLIVTLLAGRAMPLIRYRTGDRGVLSPVACPCGRFTPVLQVVTGRESDVLHLGNGHRLSPYALTSALERIDGLQRYQIFQTELTRLRIEAIPLPGLDCDAARHRICEAVQSEAPAELDIHVEFTDRLPSPGSAKFRVVQPLPHAPEAD
ncbi:MAG TPA: AMP-binding protein [Gemmatimonadales bacterium]|nr:AMP-binding protein [Gemmatimonadales bacterium]